MGREVQNTGEDKTDDRQCEGQATGRYEGNEQLISSVNSKLELI